MAFRLNEVEQEILQVCCDSNEKLVIIIFGSNPPQVYRSRFLSFDPGQNVLIIDQATPESANALPLAKGERIEVFFEFKGFRYIFFSQIVDHTVFQLQKRGLNALMIQVPAALRDGERREYYRVETPLVSPVRVFFLSVAEGRSDKVEADSPLNNVEFVGEMVDISGGGFSFKTNKHSPLEKSDIVRCRFQLKPELAEVAALVEVRYRRAFSESDNLFGMMFLGEERNPNLRTIRKTILHYVIERQRELLFT